MMEGLSKQEQLFMAGIAALAKQTKIRPGEAVVLFGRLGALMVEFENIRLGVTPDDGKARLAALFAEGLNAHQATTRKPH